MRRDILEQIRKEFVGEDVLKAEVKVGGRSWLIKVLNAGEEAWRDKHISISPSMGFLSTRKLATVAAALVAIDGISVQEIFGSKEKQSTPEHDLISQFLQMDIDERYQIAEAVLKFLSELPTKVIDRLYDEYVKLDEQREAQLKDLVENF